ncbi:g8038 [Coccomyxa viridis]|uniref:G8038 protein n=1 Tax=Coccomyxa viridis TaxID=1274662 RepID=A0ABP1G3U6_9CHLO
MEAARQMRYGLLEGKCTELGIPFLMTAHHAVDPTNKDTFFARNHLRKLMGSQQAPAACVPQEVADRSTSQAPAIELACPSMLLEIERLRESSKYVAVRALSKAIVGISHPNVDAQAVCVMHRKVAEQLWTALQPGREPRVFRRGGSTECRVPGAASLTVLLGHWSARAKQAAATQSMPPVYYDIYPIMASKPVSIYELTSDDNRYFSPFCWATRFALIHKGLKYETVPWHFQEQDKIKMSNQGLVPVIIDENQGGKCVNDSWEIAKYLEKTYPDQPSLFKGTSGEALCYFATKSAPVMPLMECIILDLYNAQLPEHKAWFKETREERFGTSLEKFCKGEDGVKAFREKLQPFRDTVQEYQFLGGTSPCYADMYLLAFFMLAYAVSPIKLLAKDDPLYSWRDRMLKAFDNPHKAHGQKGFQESL